MKQFTIKYFKYASDFNYSHEIVKACHFDLQHQKYSRYNERKQILRETIQAQKSDILCLQEVSFLGNNQVDFLVADEEGKLNLYNQHHAESQLKFHTIPGADPESKLDGNSILVKQKISQEFLEVEKEEQMHLSGFRVAQALKFRMKGDNQSFFWVVNTHLHHVIEDALIRQHQLEQLHLWLFTITNFQTDNIFLCGDFNLTPAESTYDYITNKMGFISSYKKVHQIEPTITFPTGLQAPRMDTDPAGCFDYIWIKGNGIEPIDVQIFGNKQLETDSTIYPSDHMGLRGEMILHLNQ